MRWLIPALVAVSALATRAQAGRYQPLISSGNGAHRLPRRKTQPRGVVSFSIMLMVTLLVFLSFADTACAQNSITQTDDFDLRILLRRIPAPCAHLGDGLRRGAQGRGDPMMIQLHDRTQHLLALLA